MCVGELCQNAHAYFGMNPEGTKATPPPLGKGIAADAQKASVQCVAPQLIDDRSYTRDATIYSFFNVLPAGDIDADIRVRALSSPCSRGR
jgi:hypothetical protein